MRWYNRKNNQAHGISNHLICPKLEHNKRIRTRSHASLSLILFSLNRRHATCSGATHVSQTTRNEQHTQRHREAKETTNKSHLPPVVSHYCTLINFLTALFDPSLGSGEEVVVVFMTDIVVRGEAEEDNAGGESPTMEIGWPTDVRHVAHVTFDRFHGFLGLPVELQPEVSGKAPSASKTVFGVSTESMQYSYDSRGNSVPTILLLMQQRLYEQGGLKVEGIFRITAEDEQEQYVRDQLNCGVVPEGIDVHCLAGLIKAWFRELPGGLLDAFPAEEVMQCKSDDDCAQLCAKLPVAKAALLDWAINLMADVAQEECSNKMSTRNVAMVFAPNMTQAVDPLTALKHAVQVMNFLNMLIESELKDREQSKLQQCNA